MLTGRSDYRLISQPHPVFFAGFRSTTTALQQAGWELAAEQDMRTLTVRLLLKFAPARMWALTSAVPCDFFRDDHMRLEFHVQRVCSDMRVELMESHFDFKQIDAKPQMVSAQRRSIEDFGIFATPLARTEEIIVEPETVADLLDKIKKLQDPELAAIRKRNLVRDRGHQEHGAVQRQTFHAQILSIAA